MQLTKESFGQFVGGRMEIRSSLYPHTYCGEIGSIEVENDILVVKFARLEIRDATSKNGRPSRNVDCVLDLRRHQATIRPGKATLRSMDRHRDETFVLTPSSNPQAASV